MWTGGRVVARRTLPSLLTMTRVPDSATARFAPEIPMSAWMKYLRISSLAIRTISRASAGTVRPRRRLRTSAIFSLVRWSAGAVIWEGLSPASWMIHSPRSVSTTWRPSFSRALFRPTSSLTMDFDLTMSRAFFSRAIRRIVSIASWGTEALCTRAPAFSASRLKRSMSSGSRPMFFSRIARAFCFTSSQGISRLAWRYLALCWLEARLRAVWRLTSLRAFLARRRVFSEENT